MALYVNDTIPLLSQDAMTIFDERYLAELVKGPTTNWATELGDLISDTSPLTRFPMSLLNIVYQKFGGENRFTSMGERSFDLKVEEFDTGVEVKMLDLQLGTYSTKRWADVPRRFLDAEATFRTKMIATMLEANTALTGWDNLTLFNDAHLANGVDASNGTFDNLQSTTKDVVNITNLEVEITEFMKTKDENGAKLGNEATHIGVPTEKYQALTNLLKQDIIASAAGTATVTNPYKGVLTIVHMPELTDPNDWYIFDMNLISKGVVPWLIKRLDPGPDLGLRRFGPESDYAKSKGKLAISSHIWYGAGAAFPHGMRKVLGA